LKSKLFHFLYSLNQTFLICKFRYAQILRSLSQEVLQRIHNGHTIAENLEETTDLNDVHILLTRERFQLTNRF
jgi:hypothetical protein